MTTTRHPSRPAPNPDDTLTSLAETLIATRRKARLTQQQVADAMGTTQAAIARMESGRQLPSTRTLQRFAEATNTDVHISFRDKPRPRKGLLPMSRDPRHPRAFMNWLASRRTLLGSAAGAAAGTALLARDTSAQDATPGASPATDVPANGTQPDGTWVFTDDRGVTVTLPKQPERIFADLAAAAPLWDFGIHPLAVSGWTTSTDVAWGNVDRSLEDITAPDTGMPDAEKLVALQPDLYVSITWLKNEPSNVNGFVADPEALERVNSIVPIVCIAATGLADENLFRFETLAELLGADMNAPELAASRDTFDRTVSAFTQLATEMADLTTFFANVGTEAEWYAATIADWADLAWFQKLGLTIIDIPAEPGAYWERLSREQALTYPADIFVNSARSDALSPEELQQDPIFGQHPAIKAGQIGGWNQDFILSYQGLTTLLTDLTSLLQRSHKIV